MILIFSFLKQWNAVKTESTGNIQELTAKLRDYEQELTEQVCSSSIFVKYSLFFSFYQKEQLNELREINEKQKEEINQLENERNSNVTDLKYV